MARSFVQLRKIEEAFGCIPHPVSFYENPTRCALLARLAGCRPTDIVAVDIGTLGEDCLFESVPENESHLYHIDDMVMVAYLEVD